VHVQLLSGRGGDADFGEEAIVSRSVMGELKVTTVTVTVTVVKRQGHQQQNP
jgi:hypothetical protein